MKSEYMTNEKNLSLNMNLNSVSLTCHVALFCSITVERESDYTRGIGSPCLFFNCLPPL